VIEELKKSLLKDDLLPHTEIISFRKYLIVRGVSFFS
jgi:hypothetical protein